MHLRPVPCTVVCTSVTKHRGFERRQLQTLSCWAALACVRLIPPITHFPRTNVDGTMPVCKTISAASRSATIHRPTFATTLLDSGRTIKREGLCRAKHLGDVQRTRGLHVRGACNLTWLSLKPVRFLCCLLNCMAQHRVTIAPFQRPLG